MVDDHDALRQRLAKDGFESRGIHRHDADGVNALCDEVLDDLGLHGGVGLWGPLLEDVDPGGLAELLDADFHPDEPGVRGVLGNQGDLPGRLRLGRLELHGIVVLGEERHREHENEQQRYDENQCSFHFFLLLGIEDGEVYHWY